MRMGQRLTGMTRRSKSAFPSSPSMFKFAQHGQAGAWISELAAAHRPKIVDDLSLRQVDAHRGDQSRSGHHVHSDRQPQSPAGRASGAWLSYGLGSENRRSAGLRA